MLAGVVKHQLPSLILLVTLWVLSSVLLSEIAIPFVGPGHHLEDHCMGVAWEDQGTLMVDHHMDGEDQKALVVQDSLLVVLELLFDRTFYS